MVMEEEATDSIFATLVLFNVVLPKQKQDESLCIPIVVNNVSEEKVRDHKYQEDKEEQR